MKLSARVRAEEITPQKMYHSPKQSLLHQSSHWRGVIKSLRALDECRAPATFQRLDIHSVKLFKLTAELSGELDSPPAGAILHMENEFQMQSRVLVHLQNTNCSLNDVHLLKFPPAVQLWVNMERALPSKPLPIHLLLPHCHIHGDTGSTME